MKIRNAKPEDLNFILEGIEQIRKIERYVDPKPKIKDIKEAKAAIKNKNIRVIDMDNMPAAYLYYRLDFKIMYIDELFLWVQRIYVRKKYRKIGLGKKLYEGAKKIAKRANLKKILCDVYEVNKNSKVVHAKLGFIPIYTIYRKKI